MTEDRVRRGLYLPPFGPFGDPNAVVDHRDAADPPRPDDLRRAASYDGIFPISDHTLRPEAVADLVEALRGAGGQVESRYDVVVSGNASSAWRRPNPDGVDLPALAEAGATWWLESLIHTDPLALSLEVVDARPP